MPENSNPQVVKFSNEQIRTVADDLYQLYWKAKSVVQNYTSDGIGALVTTAGDAELIADGSVSDGRTRITGNDLKNLITALSELIDYVEGGTVTTANRVDVITKPHVQDS